MEIFAGSCWPQYCILSSLQFCDYVVTCALYHKVWWAVNVLLLLFATSLWHVRSFTVFLIALLISCSGTIYSEWLLSRTSWPFFFLISLWLSFFVDFRLSLLKIRRILLLRGTTKPLGRKRKCKRSQQEKQQRKLQRKLQTRNQSAISVSWIYRLALSVKHGSTHLLTGAVFSLFCNT
jgi:hypothetical protein